MRTGNYKYADQPHLPMYAYVIEDEGFTLENYRAKIKDPPKQTGSYIFIKKRWLRKENQPLGYRKVDREIIEIHNLQDVPQPGFVRNPRRMK